MERKVIVPKRHPSGKPERKAKIGTANYYRHPLDGPINPRLQRRELSPAIGFHRHIPEEEV